MPEDKNLQNFHNYQEGFIKSLLATPEALAEVLRVVALSDIEDERFSAVYEAMISLDQASEEVTLPGILNEINNTKDLVLAPEWVLSLDSDITNWVVQGSPMTWANLVKAESARTKTRRLLQAKLDKLDDAVSPANYIGEIATELEELSIQAADNMLKSPAETVQEYIEYLDTLNTEDQEPIPSPYPSIDKYTGGWRGGNIITVGARTGKGKTVIATNSALHAAQAGKSVLYFSLEMSTNELMTRLAASRATVELGKITDGRMSPEETERLSKALEEYSKLNLRIDDKPEMTIDYISSTAIKQSRTKEGLDFIVVDYLQLVTPSSKRTRSRQEEVSEMSRKLKILAKKLRAPIMVLVQLNRADKDEEDDRLPRLDDIRESGAVAQDSDVVLLIHRKKEDEEQIDPEALFILDKNRHGPAEKMVSVSCMLQFGMFVDKKTVPEMNYNQARPTDAAVPSVVLDSNEPDEVPWDVSDNTDVFDTEVDPFDDSSLDNEGDY